MLVIKVVNVGNGHVLRSGKKLDKSASQRTAVLGQHIHWGELCINQLDLRSYLLHRATVHAHTISPES
jgi:hypothetical protein